ncbi:MAG: 4'-phosphopantetheinyl transferase superfamily protein [Lysobacterales bacterium]
MELPGNEVHLYFSQPEQIADPELLARYETLLTGDERTQMSRLYFARHRQQYLITRALIRTTLSSYFPVEPADWRFGKNGYGKPEITYPDTSWAVRFNLSHCDGLVLCGITREHDIGVDVEDVQRSTGAAFDRLSSYFSAPEIAELAQLPPEQQKQRFFDYWTLKESYIKARGMGLAIPLSKFTFRFVAGRLDGFELHPELGDDANKWQFRRISMIHRYRLALALNTDTDFKVKGFNTIPLQGCFSETLNFL